jgi:hypothetical protein
MRTPQQEIASFLDGAVTSHGRRLDVAICFARSMARELRAGVNEWEQAALDLEQQRGEDRPATALARPGQQHEGSA